MYVATAIPIIPMTLSLKANPSVNFIKLRSIIVGPIPASTDVRKKSFTTPSGSINPINSPSTDPISIPRNIINNNTTNFILLIRYPLSKLHHIEKTFRYK